MLTNNVIILGCPFKMVYNTEPDIGETSQYDIGKSLWLKNQNNSSVIVRLFEYNCSDMSY